MKYGNKFIKTYLLPDNSLLQLRADIAAAYKEIMPLCVKDNGELLTPESFKYCARVIHHEMGNEYFHSHCLRHTHGTILAEGGVNPKTVMERLGHKDIKTTLQTYTFNTDVMQQAAVDIFEKSLQDKKSGWTFRFSSECSTAFFHFLFISFLWVANGWQID